MADALNGYLYNFNVYIGAAGERKNSTRGEGSTYVIGAIEGETPSVVLQQPFPPPSRCWINLHGGPMAVVRSG